MTTIAYKDGILAADTSCICDGVYEGRISKIVRAKKSNALIAIAGDAANIAIFTRWFEGGQIMQDKPQFEHFAALVAYPNGIVGHYDGHLEEMAIHSSMYAVGSGREFAMGAMAAGKTAKESVEIACRFDILSAPPIDAVTVRDTPGKGKLKVVG